MAGLCIAPICIDVDKFLVQQKFGLNVNCKSSGWSEWSAPSPASQLAPPIPSLAGYGGSGMELLPDKAKHVPSKRPWGHQGGGVWDMARVHSHPVSRGNSEIFRMHAKLQYQSYIPVNLIKEVIGETFILGPLCPQFKNRKSLISVTPAGLLQAPKSVVCLLHVFDSSSQLSKASTLDLQSQRAHGSQGRQCPQFLSHRFRRIGLRPHLAWPRDTFAEGF